MNDLAAAAFLIVITSAWSGDNTTVLPQPSMQACSERLAELKVSTQSTGTVAAVATCSTSLPDDWLRRRRLIEKHDERERCREQHPAWKFWVC